MRSIAKHIVLLAAFVGLAQSQTLDSSRILASGLVYRHIVKPGPYDIHVLELDLQAKGLALKSSLARGLTRTSAQVAARTQTQERILGAVNADFFSFSTQLPVGSQIIDGKPVMGIRSQRCHFFLDRARKPHFERVTFEGKGWLPDRKGFVIQGINIRPGRDSIIIQTSEWFDSTHAVRVAARKRARLSGTGWGIGDTMRFIVHPDVGGALEDDEIRVCSGEGDSSFAIVAGLRAGDTLSVLVGFAGAVFPPVEMLGGGGRLLAFGEQLTVEKAKGERLSEDFMTKRHPRTFLGFDKDTTKFWIVVVDGRQSTSIGMNFQEMGAFLKEIGAVNGLNLDGGGSTTMVVDGRIVNSPSDKSGERPVANILQVVRRE